MRTNIPGIFAAGEIMDKVYKQVATSVGQGCAAAMQAERFLADLDAEGYHSFEDPRAFYQLEHSLT
jgi:thioredoxin reductase (NADPH)